MMILQNKKIFKPTCLNRWHHIFILLPPANKFVIIVPNAFNAKNTPIIMEPSLKSNIKQQNSNCGNRSSSDILNEIFFEWFMQVQKKYIIYLLNRKCGRGF